MVDSRLYTACMSMFASMQYSVGKVADTFRIGRKQKITKQQRKRNKISLYEKLEQRRYRMLIHQTMSFMQRDKALNRLSPQVRVLTPAAKRNVKAGILGRRGGLKT